jgi:formylglycine-generating enzyme required for sulfatase activity
MKRNFKTLLLANRSFVSPLVLLFLAITSISFASNIIVTNPLLTNQDATKKTAVVQFDLSWDNSFRFAEGTKNYDAAWVFVKYRIKNGGDGTWNHAFINPTDYTAPAGCTVNPTSDGAGSFIYKSESAVTANKNAWKGIQLQWNYGKNGLADNSILEIHVYAIEMVNVPAGAFYLGTGADPFETSSFTAANSTTGPATPLLINSGKAPYVQGNNLKSSPNNLSARSLWDLTLTSTDSVANGFPTGCNAFYCMKYEVTQQEYIDFLNSLTYSQQVTRTVNAPNSPAGTGALCVTNTNRNGICIATPGVSPGTPAVYTYKGNKSVPSNSVPCNFLSWADLAAFLDWSGLRPFTELEFEKACRGIAKPVPNEYAWGNTTLIQNTGVFSSSNKKAATPNCTYGNNTAVQGPLRILASEAVPANRVVNGTTIYGIFDMSGNVYERPVTIANKTGRAFNGSHGDGNLTATGEADAPTWPKSDSYGTGFKGGSWYSNAEYLRVSDRSSIYASANRLNTFGGRGARTAPNETK